MFFVHISFAPVFPEILTRFCMCVMKIVLFAFSPRLKKLYICGRIDLAIHR